MSISSRLRKQADDYMAGELWCIVVDVVSELDDNTFAAVFAHAMAADVKLENVCRSITSAADDQSVTQLAACLAQGDRSELLHRLQASDVSPGVIIQSLEAKDCM